MKLDVYTEMIAMKRFSQKRKPMWNPDYSATLVTDVKQTKLSGSEEHGGQCQPPIMLSQGDSCVIC